MQMVRGAFVAALVAAVAASGCSGPIDEEYGWQPLHGEKHTTPKSKFVFYWVGPYGLYQTPEDAGKAIDEAFFEFYQMYQARHIREGTRQLAIYQVQDWLRGTDIQLYADWKVPGASKNYEYGIWWSYNNQIDTAMGAPMHWDSYVGAWSEGVQNLRHEWMHLTFGEGH
jgi:hypothetical protein